MTPAMAFEPPAGSVVLEIAPPRIAESAGAVMTEWNALRRRDDSLVVVTGCVATPIPGWVDDMRPSIEGRTMALAGASAERLTGYPIDARPESARLVLRAASDLAGAPIGVARTFIGFDERRVFTCFATCVVRSTSGSSATASLNESSLPSRAFGECERFVAAARLDGSLDPPKPGAVLRCVTWAVHHPRPTAFGAGILMTFAGILAIVARRRPRSA